MDRICPFLALSVDGRSVVDGVDPAHRCLADEPPAALERGLQAQLCLTSAHDRCERYRAAIARGTSAAPEEQRGSFGYASTRLVLAPEPSWRGIAGRARRSRVPRVALALTALLLVGGGIAAAVASGGLNAAQLFGADAGSPSTAISAAASSTPRSTPRPRATPTPIATASASPTLAPTPTVTPTPAPTVAATPAPAPPAPVTYVVQAGDTLAAIAQQYDTSVAALQAANGIADPNNIRIGQVLVIP